MSNLLLNVAQVAPIVALAAPTQIKEFNEKEEFKTLNFLAENALIFTEILEIFKDVKTVSEQAKVLKSLSKEKQKEINDFFEKLHGNSKNMNDTSKSSVQSRMRVDSRWYWFGVWNLTFTKSESQYIKEMFSEGAGWSESAFYASTSLPVPNVVTPLLATLGIFLSMSTVFMESAMAISSYGNFYVAFHGIVPAGIYPGWNDGR